MELQDGVLGSKEGCSLSGLSYHSTIRHSPGTAGRLIHLHVLISPCFCCCLCLLFLLLLFVNVKLVSQLDSKLSHFRSLFLTINLEVIMDSIIFWKQSAYYLLYCPHFQLLKEKHWMMSDCDFLSIAHWKLALGVLADQRLAHIPIMKSILLRAEKFDIILFHCSTSTNDFEANYRKLSTVRNCIWKFYNWGCQNKPEKYIIWVKVYSI